MGQIESNWTTDYIFNRRRNFVCRAKNDCCLNPEMQRFVLKFPHIYRNNNYYYHLIHLYALKKHLAVFGFNLSIIDSDCSSNRNKKEIKNHRPLCVWRLVFGYLIRREEMHVSDAIYVMHPKFKFRIFFPFSMAHEYFIFGFQLNDKLFKLKFA